MTRAELATAVTALVVAYIDERIDRALELALATLTDGAARQHDVRVVGRVDRAATQPRSRRVDDPAHSPGSAQIDAEPPLQRRPVTKPTTNRALQQGKDLPPSTSTTTPATADAVPPTPSSVMPARSPASSPSSTDTPPPISFGHLPRAAAPTSRPRRRAFVPREPPPGWTPELDRREELAALSQLTAWRKTHG